MNCPKCNAPLDANARFCGSCGAPVTPAAPVAENKDYLDVNRTMAADPEEYIPAPPVQQPVQPEPPVQQAVQPEPPVQQPVQPEPPVQQPVQPEQSYQQPYQPEPPVQQAVQPEQNYQQPYQPEQPVQQAVQPEQSYQQSYQPEQQGYQPYQASGGKNFDEQFAAYQQPSQYGQTPNAYGYPQPGGVMVKQKTNKKTLIIVIVVVAALVIAGTVVGIVLGVKSCKNSNSHRLSTSSGKFIMEDSAINTNDSDTASKINKYLNENNVQRTASESGVTRTVEVHGNTLLQCYTATSSEGDQYLEMAKGYVSTPDIEGDREKIGSKKMVEVVALIKTDGKIFFSKIAK